jgi:putative SOS response-associated peptidase YedK
VCNRFRSTKDQHYLEERFQAFDQIGYQPRFNVAPTQPVATVREESGKRKLAMMRWGLIPSQASAIPAGNFNARSETVTEKPSFRALIQANRCLIPADGFYEWQQMGSVKQPFCFEVGDGDLFAFAGLWDGWHDGEQVIKSCTILTTNANALLAYMHDRMPVILSPDHYDRWLQAETRIEDALALLKPYDANQMRRYAVSTRLNDSHNESPDLAKPIEIEIPMQGRLF